MTTWPARKPTDAAQLSMLPLTDFLHPITFRYWVGAPWGLTRQALTVNAPNFLGNAEALLRLGRLLWLGVTAPAVTTSVRLELMAIHAWRGSGIGVPQPVAETKGQRTAFTAPREQSPQLLMLTGHPDDDGKRRFFLPGVPRNWVADGLLTPAGWEELMGHARSIIMGLGAEGGAQPLDWLWAYPGALEPTLENPVGVAFRRVRHIRVCYHTDRAPDVSGVA